MNPSKRKWLARLEEAAKKVEQPAKIEVPEPLPVVVVEEAQPVVQEIVEAVAAEEAPAPVAPSKKKKY